MLTNQFRSFRFLLVGQFGASSAAFARVNASSALEIMLQMKPATLQVLAPRLAGSARFDEPYMYRCLLQQVLAQRHVGCHAPDHLSQCLPEQRCFGRRTR